MWMVVHMAKSETAAEKVRAYLAEEGLLVRVRPVYRSVPSQENYFEIQVLQSEVQEARALLLERGL